MKKTFALIFLVSCSTYFCLTTYAQQESQNKTPLPLPAPRKIKPGKIEGNPQVLPPLRLIGQPCYGDYTIKANLTYEIVKQEPKIGIKAQGYPAYSGQKMNMGTSNPEGFRYDYRIIFDEVRYDVTVNMDHVIRRISTDAQTFKTPEGIAVGDSPSRVLKFSKGKPVNVKPCLYYIELKSGWRALFPQGDIMQDGTLAQDAKVVAFFREQ
jgi:hypothetical protein